MSAKDKKLKFGYLFKQDEFNGTCQGSKIMETRKHFRYVEYIIYIMHNVKHTFLLANAIACYTATLQLVSKKMNIIVIPSSCKIESSLQQGSII